MHGKMNEPKSDRPLKIEALAEKLRWTHFIYLLHAYAHTLTHYGLIRISNFLFCAFSHSCIQSLHLVCFYSSSTYPTASCCSPTGLALTGFSSISLVLLLAAADECWYVCVCVCGQKIKWNKLNEGARGTTTPIRTNSTQKSHSLYTPWMKIQNRSNSSNDEDTHIGRWQIDACLHLTVWIPFAIFNARFSPITYVCAASVYEWTYINSVYMYNRRQEGTNPTKPKKIHSTHWTRYENWTLFHCVCTEQPISTEWNTDERMACLLA